MKKQKERIIVLVILIAVLFLINYPYLDNALENFLSEYETADVERIVDGDTIIADNMTIRLLGINTPEKKEPYYEEAKVFLEEQIMNKTVRLGFGKQRYDKYRRTLAYVFLEGRSINLEIVGKGLANFYYPAGKDIHYNQFKEAWEECIKNNINLCEKSTDRCSNCIKLNKFDHENHIIVFENICNFKCELNKWEIKDEGRKKFVFENFILNPGKEVTLKHSVGNNTEDTLYWKGEDYVWTKTGDTLFLRDNKGKLVLWKNY